MKPFLCRIGLHKWNGCTCQRPGCAETRDFLHQWSEWRPSTEDPCKQTRNCSLCGKEQHSPQHNWSAWEYQSTSSCEQRRHCLDCPATDERVHHDWKFREPGWTYDEALNYWFDDPSNRPTPQPDDLAFRGEWYCTRCPETRYERPRL